MAGDVTPYLDLVTSEHRDRPKYIAMLAALLQPMADGIAAARSLQTLFDLDTAVGDQLDTVGKWVGQSRFLTTPLTGVYFSFDTAGLGFEEGTWLGPFDPITGLVALPDEAYRNLLRAVIAANQWDGTIPSAYAAWSVVFAAVSLNILIQDNGDMTMIFGLVGPNPDAVTLALLTGGYLALKPSGVRISAYLVASVPGSPLFGFDIDSDVIGGFDHGSWPISI